jgi:predicted amidohydrolase YtcJ
MENALSRQQALRGMTIWAAKANFEEAEKGSLEKGKLADFIILDKDIMSISAKEVLNTTVLATYIAGEKVYSKK